MSDSDTENKNNYSWLFWLWLIGSLFTIGYLGPMPEMSSVGEIMLNFFLISLFWPFALGNALGGFLWN